MLAFNDKGASRILLPILSLYQPHLQFDVPCSEQESCVYCPPMIYITY